MARAAHEFDIDEHLLTAPPPSLAHDTNRSDLMKSTQRLCRPTRLALAAAAITALATAPALATNGYFPHGYGMKVKGMAGASTAMAEDAYGGANNPARMVWAGSRIDVGVDFFSPKRDAERRGTTAFPPLDGKVDSDKTLFLVPEFGYNQMVGQDLSLGVSVYGNGGMNTTYPQGPFQCPTGPATAAPANMLCGGGGLGQDLMQLIIAPTVAYKVSAQHALGASLLLGYQRFKAEGLQAFQGMSSAPASVTNNGYDSATGAGLRIGYMGRLSDAVSIGAAYSSKVNMGKFEKYKGLFAGAGDFDIPANYSIGVAFNPVPAWTIAIDAQRILYSGVPAVANPGSAQAPLGSDGGPGFGWRDIDVFKLGVSWKSSDALTLRAGYNQGDNPISSSDVTFNIIAPGVVTSHYTAGFTYTMGDKSEVTGAFMYAPRKSVTGNSMFNALMPFPVGAETIGMSQTSVGIAWGRRF
jgi:long-chain fatty acid transport protein